MAVAKALAIEVGVREPVLADVMVVREVQAKVRIGVDEHDGHGPVGISCDLEGPVSGAR